MIRRWAAPAAWAALVAAFSVAPLPLGDAGVADIPGADKLVHFTMYFVLAGLVNRAARWPCLACGLSVTAGCGALGGVIELLQHCTGREPDVWDALANVAGAALASWVYIRWKLKKAEREA